VWLTLRKSKGRVGPAGIALAGAVALGGCGGSAQDTASVSSLEPRFADVTADAGFTHVHNKPVLDPKIENIMPWMASVGAAAAAGDYNRDGWIDLYVTNSCKGEPNFLYRNNGDGTFTDVAAAAGVANLGDDGGVSMDCIWGDVDNDGWVDLYVVRWGRDVLFRNDGDGTFTDVTERRFTRRDGSPGTDWANGCAAIFLDYDRDGRLDIYVGNYFREVDLWNLESTSIMHDDFERSRNGGLNFLYHQNADGAFSEAAAALGVEDPGWTLAVGSADVDNDGWSDIYCANDFGPDQLFLNNGDGTFRNASDVALGFDSKKGMNVDFGDYNNDGWLDIYVTNITTAQYLQEGNMLWHNNGPQSGESVGFIDVSLETETFDGGWGWGAKFFDADNDGYLDVVAENGFISAGEGDYWYDLASWTVMIADPSEAANWPPIGDRSFSGFEQTRFWHNMEGVFTEKSTAVGLTSKHDGRGVVCFDHDNDGDLDLYIANQGQAPNFYRNDSPKSNHWLEIALETDSATGVNRDGIGSRATVVTDDGRRIRERDGGNGYAAQSDPRLHVGLGSNSVAKLVEIRWPDGGLQYLEDVPVDRLVTVRQDPSAYAATVAFDIGAPVRIARAAERRAIVPEVDPGALEAMLSEMEAELRKPAPTYAAAGLYRSRCAAYGQHDRSVSFFERLVAENPDDSRARIELALAYVDKIPTCGGVAAVVSKGTLARKSLDQLGHVIEADGESWVVLYARGMNHLHWPRSLRHSDDAAADLARCIEMQVAESHPKPYFLRTHVALGDAYAKDRKFEAARTAWRAGFEKFPGAPELVARLAIDDDDELLRYVEQQRSLERPIDTDLSFLDRGS
jgi:tetratricopeptide (TPR) repeat protein